MAKLEYDLDVTVRRRGKTRLLVLVVLLLMITIAGGYFIGFYVRTNNNDSAKDKTQDHHNKFQVSVDPKEIESNLR